MPFNRVRNFLSIFCLQSIGLQPRTWRDSCQEQILQLVPRSAPTDAFREHLKIERALELAMECVRWVDLKRWGINDQATLDELKARDSDFNNFIIDKSIRMPIPQSEVDNNPNLNQNDQY